MKRVWGSVFFDARREVWRARSGDAERTPLGSWKTEEEAHEAVDAAWRLEKLRERSRSKGRAATLLGYGRKWLDQEEVQGIRRAIDRERNRFEKHLATAEFAEWPLEAITRGDVQQWVREIASGKAEGPRAKGQRRSKRTVQRALALLRLILGAAVEAGVLTVSPAEGIRLPREEQTEEEWQILSASEVELLRTTTKIPIRAHSTFVVAVFTGLRPGELWGLRWEDIRLAGTPHLVVSRSRDRGTKGGRVRHVPLLAPALEMLERWRADEIARARAEGKKSARLLRGLVWGRESGRHHASGYDSDWSNRKNGRPGREYTQLGYRWRAGIDTEVPLKDLRHTCASHLLRGSWVAKGWIDRPLRMEEVSQWLGHSSVAVTERFYARLAPGGLLDVVPARQHLRVVASRTDDQESTDAKTDAETKGQGA